MVLISDIELQSVKSPFQTKAIKPETEKMLEKARRVLENATCKDGCFILGNMRSTSGSIGHDGVIYPAHRFISMAFNPDVVHDASVVVCHRCNEGRCINPEHLYPGTKIDNQIDMRLSTRAERKGSPISGTNLLPHPKKRPYYLRAPVSRRDTAHRLAEAAKSVMTAAKLGHDTSDQLKLLDLAVTEYEEVERILKLREQYFKD